MPVVVELQGVQKKFLRGKFCQVPLLFLSLKICVGKSSAISSPVNMNAINYCNLSSNLTRMFGLSMVVVLLN